MVETGSNIIIAVVILGAVIAGYSGFVWYQKKSKGDQTESAVTKNAQKSDDKGI